MPATNPMTVLEATVEIVKSVMVPGGASAVSGINMLANTGKLLDTIDKLYNKLCELEDARYGEGTKK